MDLWEANSWWVSNVHIGQRCEHINWKLGLHKGVIPDPATEPLLPCLGLWNMSPEASQSLQQQSTATPKNEDMRTCAIGVVSVSPKLLNAYIS